jgi:nitroreductase
MEIYDAMSTLRAVRRLKSDPVPDDVLERVLQAATWAPTGGNIQPWRIVAVKDSAKKARLGELYAPLWQNYTVGYRQHMTSMNDADRAKSERTIGAGDYLAEHMGEVPVIAVFCYNPKLMAITDAEQPRPSVVGGGSVYPAVQNLLLACRNEGLGCVLTTLLCMAEPEVKTLLGMPEDWYTCAHVPIGYPVGGGHGPIHRRGVDRMVYEDGWAT